MKKWGALEWVVFLLTLLIVITVGGSWVVGLIYRTTLDDVRIKIIESIYSNTMAVIALYIGAELQKRKDK